MGVGRSEAGGRWWWCRFNASISAQEGRRRNEALSEDEAEAASSSWLNWKEASHDAVAWQRRPEERQHQREEREETTPCGLTQILLGQKIKKIYTIDSAATKWRVKI
jgi:hypothetical protein